MVAKPTLVQLHAGSSGVQRWPWHPPQTKVPSKRHHYKDLDVVRAAVSKTQALPKTAFVPSGAAASIDFSAIESTQQKTDWFSPCAANVGIPYADIFSLRAAQKCQNFDILQNYWMTECVDANHYLAFGFIKSPTETEWFIGLHCWPKSSVFFCWWP